ncbi:carboxypeptidase regulatory-like domain-containing protein [bacterium]|nr:MAG: carboxypeptidase regulatory-like domain-containing protein [bacterium]
MISKVLLITITVLILLSPAILLSHGVSITAHREGEKIHMDSHFVDGKPLANARVVVYDMTGSVIREGNTDNTGRWDFTDPKAEALRIVVSTASGHRKETVLMKRSNGNQPEDLEKQLISLQNSILELEKQIRRPGMIEVFGGLGWIVGIAGSYLWGVSRRRGGGESGRMGEGE